MKKIINLLFCRFFVTVSFVLFLSLFGACKRTFSPDEKTANDKPEADKNYIHLQNQSDHSGILIQLMDTDVMAVTDSLGYFVLPKTTDGEYTLQAKYPFFEIFEQRVEVTDSVLQTKIRIELEQQIQFWVEPAETTFSISEKNKFWKYKAYATNISDNVYEGRSRSGTSEWGLVPENINWNFGGNDNINSKRCFQDFTYIGPIDILEGTYMYLQPGDTTYRRKEDICLLGFECTPPGRTYLLFYVFVDQMHFDEYFQRRFFVDGKTDSSQIYNPLTKSFFTKRELFRPTIIHFTH
ncbi:MAG: hypothetical protein GWP06_12145 [Actinobacteria bacterium]|nr:hypothetical protein [Actinomycetota bacterium]